MKKLIVLLLLLFIISPNIISAANSEIKVYMNDEQLKFDESPYIENGVTFVPFRLLFTKLGYGVEWNQSTQTIYAKSKTSSITLKIGSKEAMVVGVKHKLDGAPVVKNGNTFVPLRFVSQVSGYDVKWDSKNRIIKINNEQIIFKDSKFEKVIRDFINKPNGVITSKDVAHVTGLHVMAEGVTSIEGIQYFKNLKEIGLSYTNLSDIEPLALMNNLESVSIQGENLTDLSPLSKQLRLKGLGLYGTSITDLSPLSELINLETLVLPRGTVTDISPLKKLNKLKTSNEQLLIDNNNKYLNLSGISGVAIEDDEKKYLLYNGMSFYIDENGEFYVPQYSIESIRNLLSVYYNGYDIIESDNPYVDGIAQKRYSDEFNYIDVKNEYLNATERYYTYTIMGKDTNEVYNIKMKKGDYQGVIVIKQAYSQNETILLPIEEIFKQLNVSIKFKLDTDNNLMLIVINK